MNRENLTKIVLFLIPVLMISVGYKSIQFIRPEGFIVSTFIDEMIPYISYFIIPYVLYFPFLLVPFIVLWKRPNEYKRMALTFILVIAISEIIYLIFQTAVIRPEITVTNILDEITLLIYGADNSVNVLPSLHTSLSIIAALFIWRYNKRLGIASSILAILIILSTLFTKQHVIPDVITGSLLAFGVYYLVGKYDSRFKTRS